MNKYKEAFDELKEVLYLPDKYLEKRLNILQELVEKATPKKAILVHNYDGYVYECPNCHNDFRPNYFADNITWKGCPYCLHALDWSEDTKKL